MRRVNMGKMKDVWDKNFGFVNAHLKDTIAYMILIIGIILSLFQPFLGGLLIGIVGGIYFSQEIANLFKNLKQKVENEGIIRSLIIAGITLGFFIASPGIFIGAALSVVVIELFF